jgi:hypothetical protein
MQRGDSAVALLLPLFVYWVRAHVGPGERKRFEVVKEGCNAMCQLIATKGYKEFYAVLACVFTAAIIDEDPLPYHFVSTDLHVRDWQYDCSEASLLGAIPAASAAGRLSQSRVELWMKELSLLCGVLTSLAAAGTSIGCHEASEWLASVTSLIDDDIMLIQHLCKPSGGHCQSAAIP